MLSVASGEPFTTKHPICKMFLTDSCPVHLSVETWGEKSEYLVS